MYFAVTPFSQKRYLAYRLISPWALSLLVGPLVVAISGLTEFGWAQLTIVLLIGSVEAPMFALFLAAYAQSKVEGLALSKLAGVLMFAPILGVLLDSPWRYLAGVVPSFWMAAVLESGDWAVIALKILAAVAIHYVFFLLLYRRFAARIG